MRGPPEQTNGGGKVALFAINSGTIFKESSTPRPAHTEQFRMQRRCLPDLAAMLAFFAQAVCTERM